MLGKTLQVNRDLFKIKMWTCQLITNNLKNIILKLRIIKRLKYEFISIWISGGVEMLNYPWAWIGTSIINSSEHKWCFSVWRHMRERNSYDWNLSFVVSLRKYRVIILFCSVNKSRDEKYSSFCKTGLTDASHKNVQNVWEDDGTN